MALRETNELENWRKAGWEYPGVSWHLPVKHRSRQNVKLESQGTEGEFYGDRKPNSEAGSDSLEMRWGISEFRWNIQTIWNAVWWNFIYTVDPAYFYFYFTIDDYLNFLLVSNSADTFYFLVEIIIYILIIIPT